MLILSDMSIHEQPLVIDASDGAQAINIKLGKSDGNAGLSSDYFKNGCDELVGFLSLPFTALLIHGSVPVELAISSVISIPKGRGLNVTDSKNYRGFYLALFSVKCLI